MWRILIDPKLTEGEETESEETEDEDKPVEKLTELAILRLEYAAAVKENAKQPVVSVLIRGHDSSLNALAWWQGGKFAGSGLRLCTLPAPQWTNGDLERLDPDGARSVRRGRSRAFARVFTRRPPSRGRTG